MAKPTLLMDVDGVLVPFGYIHRDIPESDVVPDEAHQVVEVNAYGWELKVCLSDRAVDLLKQLSEHFEIVWFTGWDNAVRQLEPTFGLGELPVLRTRTRFSSGPRKHEALEWWIEDLEEDGQKPCFLWIDDDELRAFALSKVPDGCKLLLIKDPDVGLTQEHVDEAIAWAKEVAENEALQHVPSTEPETSS